MYYFTNLCILFKKVFQYLFRYERYLRTSFFYDSLFCELCFILIELKLPLFVDIFKVEALQKTLILFI